MIEEPLVSIITPAYNVERFIEETVSSVIKQTFSSWEMIIADDGSTDKTVRIASKIASSDSRVNVFRFPHSGLPAISRNNGLSHARGRFIAFLDADDLWEPQKLDLQIASLERNKLSWGFTNAKRFGTARPYSCDLIFPEGWRPPKPFMPKLLAGNGIPCLTVIINNTLLQKISLKGDTCKAFDESVELRGVEDWDLALRLSNVSEPDYLPEALARYRVHGGGITGAIEKRYESSLALLEKYRRNGVSKHLIRQAENFHLSKISINRMYEGTKKWRNTLIISCLSLPLSPRNIYLMALALMPKSVAREMYKWGLQKLHDFHSE